MKTASGKPECNTESVSTIQKLCARVGINSAWRSEIIAPQTFATIANATPNPPLHAGRMVGVYMFIIL